VAFSTLILLNSERNLILRVEYFQRGIGGGTRRGK
jgi:hypothetical protein